MIFKNINIELIKIIQFNIIFIFIFLKMSDFEYEYNSNSDNDNISYDYSMSDTNYSDDDIEDDLIEVIIILPGQLFLNTPVPCCLWFINKDKTQNGRDRRKETLFIDGRDLGSWNTRTIKELTDKDILKISETVLSWRSASNYKDIKGFCRSVDINEIKKNDFSLNPGRFVGFFENNKKSNTSKEKVELLLAELENLNKEGTQLDKKISEIINEIYE